jgi:hypothetical protein
MSFKSFLCIYEAPPSTRRDGYSPSDFADMSDEERTRARAMLLERGLTGDTIDIDGLRYVGDQQTVTALTAVENRAADFDPVFDAQRLETLFVLTGDPHHLFSLLAWVDGSDAPARAVAAQALARQKLPADFAALIAQRLTEGRHEDVVLSLVQAWMATRGELIGMDMAAFQRHLPLIRAVCKARPAARAQLLARERQP